MRLLGRATQRPQQMNVRRHRDRPTGKTCGYVLLAELAKERPAVEPPPDLASCVLTFNERGDSGKAAACEKQERPKPHREDCSLERGKHVLQVLGPRHCADDTQTVSVDVARLRRDSRLSDKP